MLEAMTYQDMLSDINKNARKNGIINDTIGILITRPDLPTGKQIMNSLEYFHFRTGKSVNFYLPGYGAYWTKYDYPDGIVVTRINGVEWSFSNEMFVSFIQNLEHYSKWQYSGESELLLVELKDNVLSYQNTMQFHLDNMLRDRVIGSIPQFFETLFRVCANKDSLQQISNIFGQKTVKHVSMEFVLSNVPSGLRKIFTEEKQEISDIYEKTNGQESSDTFVKMDGQEIFRFAVKEVPKCINELMEKMNITSDDVDMFVLHQANLRICQGIAKRLKISMDKVPTNVSEYGNTSSACIPILLDELFKAGKLKKGDKIIMSGFGAGVTLAATYLEIC